MTDLISTAAAVVNRAISCGELRGAVIAVADRYNLLAYQAFGRLGTLYDDRPLAVTDRFLLTSITKTLTAIQVLQLVERGQVALDVPLAEYIPEFGCNGKDGVTLWHVLTHTSGMDQSANTVERSNPEMSAADHLQVALTAPLHFLAGERVEYCSPPFWVLGELIQRLGGASYADDLHTSITEPCGMRDTGYAPGADVDLVPAYGLADLALPDQQRRLNYPAGAVVSTAADLIQFGQILLNSGLIPSGDWLVAPVTLHRATQSHTNGLPGNPVGTRRGLGFVIGGPGSLRSPETFGHGGASGTYFWIDPLNELVMVFLSAHWGLPRRILASVADAIVAQRSLELEQQVERGQTLAPEAYRALPFGYAEQVESTQASACYVRSLDVV